MFILICKYTHDKLLQNRKTYAYTYTHIHTPRKTPRSYGQCVILYGGGSFILIFTFFMFLTIFSFFYYDYVLLYNNKVLSPLKKMKLVD